MGVDFRGTPCITVQGSRAGQDRAGEQGTHQRSSLITSATSSWLGSPLSQNHVKNVLGVVSDTNGLTNNC